MRLTGEWAIDAADASGTLLFDVATGAGARRSCAALDIPARVASARQRVDEIAGAGDQQAAALGVGVDRAGHGLGRPRHLGRRPRCAPGVRTRSRRRACTPSAMRSRSTWEAMGVMLNAAGVAALVPRRLRAGASFDDLTEEAARWEAGADGVLFLPVPPGRADAARRSATRRARSPASRSATTAAPLRAPCSRASPTACATRSSSCASSASSLRRDGRRAAARAAASGSRSSPRCSTCRSSARVVDEGSAYGAALLAGVADGTFAARRRRSRAASAYARRSSRTLRGRVATRTVTLAIARCTRRSEEWRSGMRLEGKVAFVTGASRGIGAAVGARSRTRESRSGSPRAAATTSGSRTRSALPATSATTARCEDAVARTAERFGGSTSASRTPASARTARSWTARSSTSRR